MSVRTGAILLAAASVLVVGLDLLLTLVVFQKPDLAVTGLTGLTVVIAVTWVNFVRGVRRRRLTQEQRAATGGSNRE